MARDVVELQVETGTTALFMQQLQFYHQQQLRVEEVHDVDKRVQETPLFCCRTVRSLMTWRVMIY